MARLRFRTLMLLLALTLFTGCGGGGSSGGGGPVDDDPPIVALYSPASGAESVPVGGPFSVTFSEEMDPATLTQAAVFLTGPSGAVAATLAYDGLTVELTLAAPLEYGQSYTFNVTTDATDLAGNPLFTPVSFTFTTEAAPDTTPPTVTGRTPAPDAAGVAVASTVTATFSEALDPATVTGTSFTLTGPSGAVAGTVEYAGTTATFTPSSALAYATEYTATLTVALEDLAGNPLEAPASWTFTTADPPDTTPPTVTGRSPAPDAAGVAINSAITATFSEALDPATVTETSFTLTGPSGAVEGAVDYAGTTATFTPSAALAYSTTYTATLTVALEDLAGNPLFAPVSFTFTTEAAPDTTPPTVTGRSPAPDATGVAIASAVTATFSEALDPATVTETSFTLTGPSGAVAGTVDYAGTTATFTATFTPTSALAYAAEYTATLSVELEDLAGNPQEAPVNWTFTTVAPPDTTPPTVTGRSPAPDAAGVAIASTVTATFSEALDPATVTGASFTLTGPSGAVAGTVDYAGTTATFRPSAALAYATEYTATLTVALEDLVGNPLATEAIWTFTTAAPPDTTPPTIRDYTRYACCAPVDTTFTVVFSEPLDPATVNASTIGMSEHYGNVDGTLTYNELSATFTPSQPLQYSTYYTIKVAGVKDTSGNSIVGETQMYLSTEEKADLERPYPVGRFPTAGASSVPVGTPIYVRFSEWMDKSSITAATFTLTGPTGSVPGTVNAESLSATFTPDLPLSYGVLYTATLTTGIKDEAGNPLTGEMPWSFTTSEGSDTTPPSVESTYPTENSLDVPVVTQVLAVFSEALDTDTLISPNFELEGPDGPVEGDIEYEGVTATFTPKSPLACSTTYTARIKTEVCDLSGNNIPGTQSWSFTTEAPGTGVRIVSHTLGARSSNRGSWDPTISTDGRYVAFISASSDLVPNFTGCDNLYLADLMKGTNRRIDLPVVSENYIQSAHHPSISADGKKLAYVAASPKTFQEGPFTFHHFSIYVLDRDTGVSAEVSLNETGVTPNNHCEYPSLSSDGSRVSFYSEATDIMPTVNEDTGHIFVRSTDSGQTFLASQSTAGVPANNWSGHRSSISGDGTLIAISSFATNLIPDDQNVERKAFVRDLTAGETDVLSVSQTGQIVGTYIDDQKISSDGRFAAFSTSYPDLVAGDTDYSMDVFVKNLATGEVSKASTTVDGESEDGWIANFPSISADGRYVLFVSNASNLIPGEENYDYKYIVRDMQTGTNILAAKTDDGEYINQCSLSADGRWVVLNSWSRDLTPDDVNIAEDIFIIGPLH